ncbi:MAG TPA: hypothetical protein VH914_03960 [Acidimicrobiia bacterium]|jgi:hypothetical protein|nr:hypothetical protein [Acidimicrobiia bacterium]
MSSRRATAAEIAAWETDGWVLLDGLIDPDEIDAAAVDLRELFPTPEQYHADPEGETERRLGRPPPANEVYTWPEDGPGFRPEQHRWQGQFPLPGSGALNRLYVHPSIVDFAERALGTDDIRLYQASVSAKYTGLTNYEQPMHTDRNHSWLPARADAPLRHVESFLYLSDVDDDCAPTHLVALRDSRDHTPTELLVLPKWDPALYAAERPARGPRGSLLVYRPDVFHRAIDLTHPRGARYLLNVSFRLASQEWVGFHTQQSRATDSSWTAFVESCTPRELALFGFPPPGHEVWDDDLLALTHERYPELDLGPWYAALQPSARAAEGG